MYNNMKRKSTEMEEVITPIKSSPAKWRRETFQPQCPM